MFSLPSAARVAQQNKKGCYSGEPAQPAVATPEVAALFTARDAGPDRGDADPLRGAALL